jgi:hypothetical protein
MKTAVLALAGFTVACTTASAALPMDGFGVGVMVGEPTGLSLKKWIGEDRAIDAGIGWSFSDYDAFHFHVDYLFHRFGLLLDEGRGDRLPVYVGIGGRIKLKDHEDGKGRDHDDDSFGIRIPLGISYLFADVPVDIFAEIVPTFDVAPDTDLDLGAAVGARYYF